MSTGLKSRSGTASLHTAIPLCPLAVKADDDGIPISVNIQGQWIQVRDVVDSWVIDNERSPGQASTRMYYECLVSKRLRITIFQDPVSRRWYW